MEESLENVKRLMQEHCDSVRILGRGSGEFVSAEKGKLGVEIYHSREVGWTIDPAIEEILQGEKDFETMVGAVNAAILWLNNGK